MAPLVAEHLDHQVRGAVHDRGQGGEMRRDIDEAAKPHAARDPAEIAVQRRLGLGEHVDGAQPRGLWGGVRYWDGQFDDARLAVLLARTAASRGAVVLNHVAVTALRREADRRGAFLSDEVMDHLLTRFARDLKHLMALLDRLDHFALAEGRVVTVPLLKKMSARGMITGDPLGLGLAVSPESEIVRPDGRTVKSAFAMGPMAIGQFFEIFAVPDIRVQANAVARRIAAGI